MSIPGNSSEKLHSGNVVNMPYYTVCTSLHYRYDALLGSKGDWDELCLRLVFIQFSISCARQEHNQWLLSALSLLNMKTPYLLFWLNVPISI